MRDGYDFKKLKRGYCISIHDGIICYKKLGSIVPGVIFIRYYITVMDLPDIIKIWGLYFLKTIIVWQLLK